MFATDHNKRDGYIYIIDKARAEKNTENSKKVNLPGDKKGTVVTVPENEWLIAVMIEASEILGEHAVSKFTQD